MKDLRGWSSRVGVAGLPLDPPKLAISSGQVPAAPGATPAEFSEKVNRDGSIIQGRDLQRVSYHGFLR